MAEKDFVVKNGIVVNTAFTANSTQVGLGSNVTLTTSTISVGNGSVNSVINSTAYIIGNNTVNSVTNSTAFTVGSATVNAVVNSSSIAIANGVFSSGWNVGANVYANATAVFVGTGSINAYITSAGLFINGAAFQPGSGYYKGNKGAIGDPTNVNNIFRINSNTVSNNITFAAGENSLAVGPITVGVGNTVTISTGSRVVIV